MPVSLRCIQWRVFFETSNACLVLKVVCSLYTKYSSLFNKVLLMRNNLVAMLFWRPMQWSQQSILSHSLTGVWWDKWLNEFGRYVKYCNVNVWRLFKHVHLLKLFSFLVTHNAVYHLRVVKQICWCWVKYCTDWLRSKYKWRHNNNVIVIKISVYVLN